MAEFNVLAEFTLRMSEHLEYNVPNTTGCQHIFSMFELSILELNHNTDQLKLSDGLREDCAKEFINKLDR